MKAWTLTRQAPMEDRPLELREVPTPHPEADQVRLRVSACGICRTDLHIAEGDLPAGKDELILGHEVVGEVDAVGDDVNAVAPGTRAGVTWLGRTCGTCRHCTAGRENYCARFEATGRDVDGGFAEYIVADQAAVFPLDGIPLSDEEAAPLLCPGVAGHCAFRLMDTEPGHRIGLYGFGPTAYYVLRVADHLGLDVYVNSRSPRNLERARRHGAVWAGNTAEEPLPVDLDGAIVFPPAGPLVEPALRRVKPGGILVLAPVAMSTIEIDDYSNHLWGRDIRTLYNVNRRDTLEFLQLARDLDLGLGTEVVPFASCQDAMIRLRRGEVDAANIVVRI